MKIFKIIQMIIAATLIAACNQQDATEVPEGRKVEATGKQETALDDIPAEVLAAASAARPDLDISEGEHELRDGREYYDVGGTLPDGSELELDMTLIDGVWTVVEVQRDIGIDLVPVNVRETLAKALPDWTPNRIIESDQGDGVIVYEFFGPGESGETKKVEVKLAGGTAELLTDEWVH